MPAESPIETRDPWRALYPFSSHWHATPGGRIHFVDEGPADSSANGTSQTLLFVHGNPTWSFHWRRLIGGLRNAFRCVAPDHLGCGLSDKPTRLQSLSDHIVNLSSLVNSLNLRNITLVAQDWGGAIGLGAALREPERIDRIVLFNTGAFPPTFIPWRIRVCRWPVFGQLAVQGANAFSRAALRMTLARTRRLDPAVTAGYLAPYDSWENRRAVYGFVKDIPTDASQPTWQTLAEIERGLPIFRDRAIALIWGMRDWCFRPECLDKFVGAWPAAEVYRLADVGHWVVEDAPEEALSIVRRFVMESSHSHA
jgi:cis-3-alkyl-4-acyloxetan-2-one decarboxylase